MGNFFKSPLDWVTRVYLSTRAKKSLVTHEGTQRISGVRDEVLIQRDSWGVPHITANNRADLFFAQGYVHAQDRLWQMELHRRTASGRLSEIIGSKALETDRAVRTFGFQRMGMETESRLTDSMREVVTAYVAGINASIESLAGKFPLEFSLLKTTPQSWAVSDVMAFSQLMTWQLSHAWYGEIVRAQILDKVGPEAAAELEAHLREEVPMTLPLGIEIGNLDLAAQLPGLEADSLDRGKGSNAWVLSGARTVSGKPLLVNDIHLALNIPSIWYANHLRSPGLHATGGSIPALPLVLVGHNEEISWGITLAFTDAEDLFVEEFHPSNPELYKVNDQWEAVQVREEEIQVKDAAPHIERVVSTRHGPIISDFVGARKKLAVQSMALRPSPVMEGWWLLNQAKDWQDFTEAMKRITAPQLNMLYADRAGNIGHYTTGELPIRRSGSGMLPSPGWDGSHDWMGSVPFDEMPHALNPKSGMLVNCNQQVVSSNFPHFLGNSWMNGYRAERVTSVLSERPQWSPEEMPALQRDFTCLPGKEWVTLWRQEPGLIWSDPSIKEAWELLLNWDVNLTADTVGGTLYEVLRYTLLKNLLEPALGEELLTRWMGRGFHPQIQFGNEFHGHETTTLLRLWRRSDSWWIQQAGGKQALLKKSFEQTVAWLTKELGSDPNLWQWGAIHQVRFRHSFSAHPTAGPLLDRGPFPHGGDTDTPCQAAIAPEDPYHCRAWAATYRQVIDLSDWENCRWVFAPGQSGQLGSAHYDDLLPKWLQGELVPMPWSEAAVAQDIRKTLRLIPCHNP